MLTQGTQYILERKFFFRSLLVHSLCLNINAIEKNKQRNRQSLIKNEHIQRSKERTKSI